MLEIRHISSVLMVVPALPISQFYRYHLLTQQEISLNLAIHIGNVSRLYLFPFSTQML